MEEKDEGYKQFCIYMCSIKGIIFNLKLNPLTYKKKILQLKKVLRLISFFFPINKPNRNYRNKF